MTGRDTENESSAVAVTSYPEAESEGNPSQGEVEFQFRTLVDNLQTGVLVQGPKAEILLCNQAALNLLGLTESQVLGKTSYDPAWNVIHEDGSPFPGETHPVPVALATGQSVRNVVMGVYRPAYRDRIWLLVNAELHSTSDGEINHVLCTFSDITKVKEAEQSRREQSEYLAALHETALALMNRRELEDLLETIVRRAGALVDSVDGFVALVEPDESEIVRTVEVGYAASPARPRTRLKKGEGIMGKVWESGEPIVVEDYNLWPDRLPGGEYSRVHAMIAFPLKSGERVVGVFGLMYLDETRRFTHLEVEKLSRFAQLASLALDNARLYNTAQRRVVELATVQRVAHAVNSTLNLEEIFQTVVRQINKAFGYQMVSIYLRTGEGLALQAYLGYDRVISFIPLEKGVSGRATRTGQPDFIQDVQLDKDFVEVIPGTKQAIVVPLKRSSGEVAGVLLIESTGQPWLTGQDFELLRLLADQIGVAIENARLFAERKQAEEARLQLERDLFENQKLQSLGMLAGGIAHEFNNLLVGILNNAELGQAGLTLDETTRQAFREIEKAAKRAATLTGQMLAYSGQGRFVIEKIELNSLLGNMTELLRASVAKNVQLEYRLTPGLSPVEADAGQLQQVILNLINNATEALTGREGIITVATGMLAATREYLRSTYLAPDLPEGDYLFIEVSDNGSGMDETTLAKIFDPFFSTKFTGRGLGLPATLGIVRGHKGALKVSSRPGEGTTFRVLLPVTAPSIEAEKPEAEGTSNGEPVIPKPAPEETAQAAPQPEARPNTILIVDDEQLVRSLLARVVQQSGYAVLEAEDGRKGVELFRAHAREISCVLLDLTMPHMNGEEALRQLRQIEPEAKVILMSGYSEDEVIQRFASQKPLNFLQKPFNLKEVLAVLNKVLPKT